MLVLNAIALCKNVCKCSSYYLTFLHAFKFFIVYFRWCDTCRHWRQELMKFSRQKHNHNLAACKSWLWKSSYESLVDFFSPFTPDNGPGLGDMSVCCHVWKNCNFFNLSAQTIQRVTSQRNKIAHSQTLTLTQKETDAVFDCLADLVKDKDVQCINQKECMNELANFRKGYDAISNLRQLREDTIDIKENVRKVIDMLNEKQENRRIQLEEKRRKKEAHNQIMRYRLKVFGFVFFCALPLCLAYDFHHISHKGVTVYRFNNCISEEFDAPFHQNIPLLGYLENHKTFVGREWLFKDIRTALENGHKKALILKAEMGYGKSAAFKHIICANKDESALWLRERALAFHVCRFDVRSTRSPARFVRRMAGFLITRLPGFKEIFDSDVPKYGLVYNISDCKEDIEACFDQAILMPLNRMSITKMSIIVIDAMDECFDYHTNDNAIFELISRRLWKLPDWLKWVIFSRDIPLEINHEHQFLIRKMVLNDSQNVRDIEQYLGVNSKHANDLHGTPTFLLATLITESSRHSFSFTTKIEEIYEDNFNHLFERGAHYTAAKSIFEIMIASLEPICINDIEYILGHMEVRMHVNDAIARIKSVVCRNDDKLSFIHQSFYDWLISNRSRVYQVNIQHGHYILAVHMLNQTPLPLVDLAIHVALSENKTLPDHFKKIDVMNAEHEQFPLHSLVRKHHSPEALSLLQTLFPDVYLLDDHHETVAFIAAALGHVDQLKFLQTKGEVLYFQKETSSKTMNGEMMSEHVIINCKTCHSLLPGFNLLHVAVYNRRYQMVKYLLEHINKTVVVSKTGTGLMPIEIACSLCDVDIFKDLKPYYAYFGVCEYFAAFGNCLNMFNYFREEHFKFGCISEQRLANCVKVVRTEVFAEVSNGMVVGSICLGNTLLHVATMNGSLEVAKFLIEHYPYLMECRNVLGITPMLISVVYNQTDVFQLMIHRVNKDRCLPSDFETVLKVAGAQSFVNSKIFFLCPPDWMFVEIAQYFKRQHMLETVQKHTNTFHVINREVYNKGLRQIKEMKGLGDTYFTDLIKLLCRQIIKDEQFTVYYNSNCRPVLEKLDKIPILRRDLLPIKEISSLFLSLCELICTNIKHEDVDTHDKEYYRFVCQLC